MENIDTLIQGGAVGLAILAIGALVYLMKIMLKIVGNHINHNTEALTKNAESNRALCELIERKLN